MLLLVARPAAAGPVLGVEAGFASASDATRELPLDPLIGATLSWDRAPPEVPEPGSHRLRGDLVPEMTGAYAGAAEVRAGVRLELDLAGSAQVPPVRADRESLWLEPRIGWRGGIVGGGALGGSIYGHGGWRIGLFAGALFGAARVIEGGLALSHEVL